MILPALAGAALAAPAPALPTAWGDCVVPTSAAQIAPLEARFAARREAAPEWFAPTPAPEAPVRWPGEFTPRSALALTWPADPDLDPVALALMAAAAPAARVVVVVDPRDRAAYDRALAAVSWDTTAVRAVEAANESVWLRDYGPVVVFAGGQRTSIDAGYFTDCIDDDAVPSKTWQAMGADRVQRAPVWMMGGSLLTDGAGTCFTTPALSEANGGADWAVDPRLRDWYGCAQVVTLPHLLGGVIDHVDMFLSVADPTTLLLGEVDRASDPVNHARLEEAAATLRATRTLDGRPYAIVRVPMVPRSPAEVQTGELALRSWLNLVPLNDRVLVPVYADASPTVQATAIARIAAAFPQREVVPVPADAAGARYGALRCLTVTVPLGP